MSDYISINIQEVEPAQSVHHSARTKSVTYLVTNPNTLTNYRHDLISLNNNKNDINYVSDYFKQRELEINQDYKSNNNNRSIKKGTKLYQEAVISFGRERFKQNNQDDILKATENFCKEFEQKTGAKILMTSLHLDEGHKDENGTIQHNYHSHLLIENYSFNTHKTCLQKLDYRKLQTELAKSFEHLGFERGDPKRKNIRLEHREYRVKAELQKTNSKLQDFLMSDGLESENLKKEIQPLVNKAFTIAKSKNLEITTYTDVAKIIDEHIQKQDEYIQIYLDHGRSLFEELNASRKENEQLQNDLKVEKDKNKNLESKLASVEQVKEQYRLEFKKLKDSKTATQLDYQELKKKYIQVEQQAKQGELTIERLHETLEKIYDQCPEKTAKTYTDIGDIAVSHIQKHAETIKFYVENESYWYNEITATKDENKHLKNELSATQSENEQLKSDLNALQSTKNSPGIQTYQPTHEELSEAIKTASKQQLHIDWQIQTIDALKNYAKTSTKYVFLDTPVYVDWKNGYITTNFKDTLELQRQDQSCKFTELNTKNSVNEFIKQNKINEIDDPLCVQLKPLERVISSFNGVNDFVTKILEKFTIMEKTISEQSIEIRDLTVINEELSDYIEQKLERKEHKQSNEWER